MLITMVGDQPAWVDTFAECVITTEHERTLTCNDLSELWSFMVVFKQH